MLRRRDLKSQEEQQQESTTDSQPETTSAEPSTSSSGGLSWRPMRQTNEEWKPQRTGQTLDGDESVIGADDFFNGAYKSQRGVRVQGRVEGSIESKKHILIEEHAQVMADMTAEDIVVAGRFNGKVNCRRRFEITPTGIVTGEINTDLLVVQEGGYFDGKLKMKERSNVGRATTPQSAVPSRSSTESSPSTEEEQTPSQV